MAKNKKHLLPQTQEYLDILGNNIRLARKRRKLSTTLVAERAGISRQTLSSIENGSASVSIGAYATTLHALDGLDENLKQVAKEDKLGRRLQDMRL